MIGRGGIFAMRRVYVLETRYGGMMRSAVWIPRSCKRANTYEQGRGGIVAIPISRM